MSYAIGRYAKAWNDLSDSWYEDRFNTGNTENEEVTESEELKEEYSEKLGGDPEDFLSDMTKIKSCIMEIGKHTIATHLAEEVIMSFLETCDNQIAMVKSRYLGEAEEPSTNTQEYKVGDIVKVPYKYGSYTPGEYTDAPIIDIDDNHFVTVEIPSKLEVTMDQLKKWNTLEDKYEEEPLKEDSYNTGIFQEIEQAFQEAGLNPTRFIDDGILTKNIGWTVYSPETGKAQQISCDGSWYDEDDLEESEKLNEDDRIMQDQNVVDIMNSYSSRNNHLKYKIEGNSAIYEDGTEITFYLNDNSEIEYTIRKDNNTTEPKLASQGLTESEKLNEDESNVYKMKDCTTDVDIINALEGETLELDDMEDWERLKNLARSLAGSQGFYGRLLKDMEEAENSLDETSFPMYL